MDKTCSLIKLCLAFVLDIFHMTAAVISINAYRTANVPYKSFLPLSASESLPVTRALFLCSVLCVHRHLMDFAVNQYEIKDKTPQIHSLRQTAVAFPQ